MNGGAMLDPNDRASTLANRLPLGMGVIALAFVLLAATAMPAYLLGERPTMTRSKRGLPR